MSRLYIRAKVLAVVVFILATLSRPILKWLTRQRKIASGDLTWLPIFKPIPTYLKHHLISMRQTTKSKPWAMLVVRLHPLWELKAYASILALQGLCVFVRVCQAGIPTDPLSLTMALYYRL